MPYIKAERQLAIAADDQTPVSPGELNYAFTNMAVRYLKAHGISYGTINDVLGALEGAKQEFYRRVAVPYEEMKRKENGDVY